MTRTRLRNLVRTNAPVGAPPISSQAVLVGSGVSYQSGQGVRTSREDLILPGRWPEVRPLCRSCLCWLPRRVHAQGSSRGLMPGSSRLTESRWFVRRPVTCTNGTRDGPTTALVLRPSAPSSSRPGVVCPASLPLIAPSPGAASCPCWRFGAPSASLVCQEGCGTIAPLLEGCIQAKLPNEPGRLVVDHDRVICGPATARDWPGRPPARPCL